MLPVVLLIIANYPWAPNVRVSVETPWDTLDQGESCFAVWGDSIYSICNTAQRSRVPIAPFAYSFNGGVSFTQVPFTDSATGITWHTDPVIEVDDSGHIHMLIQFSISRLNHYFSTNGGNTWSDTTTVTSSYGVDKPWMVVNKNEIYIVWQQTSGQTGIWFAKSTDYGRTFTLKRISYKTGVTALCMDENENLHLSLVAWGDGVYYRKSTDKGETWTQEKYLSNYYYRSGYGDRCPINSITAHGNAIFMTWVDSRNGNWDVMGMRSTDGGNTWSNRFVVNDSTAGGQFKGWALFDCYGGLHVIYYHCPYWPTGPTTPFSLRYQYSPDSGQTFYPSVRVSDTCAPSLDEFTGEYHIIRADSEYVYAIWTSGRNGDDNDLYFSKAKISEVSCPEQRSPVARSRSFTIPSIWHGEVVLKSTHPLVRISVYDGLGRLVRRIETEGKRVIRIKSGDLPEGILFLRCQLSDRTELKKVVNIW